VNANVAGKVLDTLYGVGISIEIFFTRPKFLATDNQGPQKTAVFYFNHGRYQVAAATTPPLLLRFWPMTNILIALLLVVSMISVTCLETIVEVR